MHRDLYRIRDDWRHRCREATSRPRPPTPLRDEGTTNAARRENLLLPGRGTGSASAHVQRVDGPHHPLVLGHDRARRGDYCARVRSALASH